MSIGMGITEQQSTDSVLVSNSCLRFVDLAVWFRSFLSPCFSFCPQGVLPSANLWRKRLQLQRMKAFGSRESRCWEVHEMCRLDSRRASAILQGDHHWTRADFDFLRSETLQPFTGFRRGLKPGSSMSWRMCPSGCIRRAPLLLPMC